MHSGDTNLKKIFKIYIDLILSAMEKPTSNNHIQLTTYKATITLAVRWFSMIG